MALPLTGDISFDDVKAELGLVGNQSLADLFAAANYALFNQASVNSNNSVFSERTALNINTAPHALREFLGYGGLQILRGTFGAKQDGSNIYLSSMYVFVTLAGYSFTDTYVELDGYTGQSDLTVGPNGEDWATVFDPGNALFGAIVDQLNNSETSADTYLPADTTYGTLFNNRMFQWTFSDGSTTYVADGFSDDADYFRVRLGQERGEYYGFELNAATGDLGIYVMPITGQGSGISNVGPFTAEVSIAAETSPGSGTFGAATIIDSIDEDDDPDWNGEVPTNGEYYDSDTFNSVTKTNKIFIKKNNSAQYPSRVTTNIASSTLYRVRISGAISGVDKSYETLFIYY